MSLIGRFSSSVFLTGVLVFALGCARANAATTGDLTVYAGAVFYDRPELDSMVLVDFPFTINRHEFQFLRQDSLSSDYEARIFARLTLSGVSGMPFDSVETYFSTVVRDKDAALTKGYRLFNSLSLYLRPGVYSGRLVITDVLSGRTGSVSYDKIVVESPVRDRLAIGGKCLAYSITWVGDAMAGDRLVRNGFRVLPNPLRVFGGPDTTVFLYAEIYNLSWQSSDSSSFEAKYSAVDAFGDEFRSLGSDVLRKPGSTAVIMKSFPLSAWPTGAYQLRIAVRDNADDRVDTALIGFSVLAPEAAAAIAAAALDGPDALDTLPLGVQMDLVHYLLTPLEANTLAGLTDAGKQSFLKQYWTEHDSDPTTRVVENRRMMYDRYLMANQLYSTDITYHDGWSTDRGRVYMTYGPWDSRDDIQAPRTGKPFEVWHYYSLEDGVVFVFEDTRGDSNYRQVHSSAKGERFSEYWDDVVKHQDYNLN